jgi:hypothetical protein
VDTNTSPELVQALLQRELLVFCGAGLSTLAGAPSGNELARSLAQRIASFQGNTNDLTEVATAYTALRGRHALIAFLLDDFSRRALKVTTTHLELCRLPVSAFVTTNWDNVLERALDMIQKDYITVVTDSSVPFMGQTITPVIKFHGTLAQPDTLVVTDADYYDIFTKRPGMTALMESHFASKTFMFVGYNLADPDFKRLFYTTMARFGPLRRRAYALQLSPSETTVAIWEQQNVQIIDQNAATFIPTLSKIISRNLRSFKQHLARYSTWVKICRDCVSKRECFAIQ